MVRKVGLYFLSLWLLFLLAIIITIEVPTCFGDGCSFIGVSEFLMMNPIPILCVVCLLIGAIAYFDFLFQIKGSTNIPCKVEEVENIDYEHLTFLTTYIVPLVCFNFSDTRYIVVLGLLLIIIGIIYIRTDLFYANPTLALLKFRIFKVSASFKKSELKKGIIIISREEIKKDQRVNYIKLDDRIYYGKVMSDE